MRTLSKTLASLTLALSVTVTGLVSAPAATAAPYPTHVKVVTNKTTFDRGKVPFYEIKVHATNGPGRSLPGRASLWVNGKAQRIRDLEWGWRGFRIDRADLRDNKRNRIQVRVNPKGNDHATRVITRFVVDAKETRGQKIARTAKEQVGKPYRFGTAGPGSFDCSGLVRYSLRKAVGKSVPHSSSAIRHHGRRVSKPSVGDVVWTPGHVSIYVGHGKVVEAAKPGTDVRVVNQWQRNAVYLRI